MKDHLKEAILRDESRVWWKRQRMIPYYAVTVVAILGAIAEGIGIYFNL